MSVYRFLRKFRMLLCRPTDDRHTNLSSRVPRWTTQWLFYLKKSATDAGKFITWPKRLINGRPTKIVDIDQDNGLWTAACRPNNSIFASNSSAVGRFCEMWLGFYRVNSGDHDDNVWYAICYYYYLYWIYLLVARMLNVYNRHAFYSLNELNIWRNRCPLVSMFLNTIPIFIKE